MVSFPRNWYGVSSWFRFGLSFWEDPMCSLQVGAPVLLRFPTCLVNGAVFLDTPWLRLFWKISWEWNNRPTFSLNRRLLMFWGSLGCQCDILCCRFSWAFGRLIALISCQNDPTYCCNRTTILNFFRARVEPNQYLRVACAWHSHISSSASIFVENISFFDRPNSASGTSSTK